jgi:hypothetical protein
VRAAKLNTTTDTWELIDGGTPLNYAVSLDAISPANGHDSRLEIVTIGERLVVAWVEKTESNQARIRVKAYHSGTWSFIDGGGADGLTPAANRWNENISLLVHDSRLFAAMSTYSGKNYTYVGVFNGDFASPAWTYLGGSLNIANQNAFDQNLVSVGGSLYVTWREAASGYKFRAKVFNGDYGTPVWTSVDGGGIGWNYSTADARYGAPIVFQGKLYVTWAEHSAAGNKRVIRVGVYDPSNSSYTILDGATANGLAVDNTQDSGRPYLHVHDGVLYVTWTEIDTSLGGSLFRVLVSAYNGNDAAPAFTLLNPPNATGFMNVVSASTAHPDLVTIDGSLYLTYTSVESTLVNILHKLDDLL